MTLGWLRFSLVFLRCFNFESYLGIWEVSVWFGGSDDFRISHTYSQSGQKYRLHLTVFIKLSMYVFCRASCASLTGCYCTCKRDVKIHVEFIVSSDEKKVKIWQYTGKGLQLFLERVLLRCPTRTRVAVGQPLAEVSVPPGLGGERWSL